MKDLKKRLSEGETLNGCWLNPGSSLTAEIVGKSGFEWVLIDLELGADAAFMGNGARYMPQKLNEIRGNMKS